MLLLLLFCYGYGSCWLYCISLVCVIAVVFAVAAPVVVKTPKSSKLKNEIGAHTFKFELGMSLYLQQYGISENAWNSCKIISRQNLNFLKGRFQISAIRTFYSPV